MRTKVLMVYPRFPPSFWSFSGALEMTGRRAVMAPTGLATIAAMLPAEYFEVMPIIDLNVEPLSDQRLQEADLVLFSAMIVQQDSLRELIARAHHFGKKAVVGGPFATSYTEEVLAMGADHLVLGEAELTLAPFVTDLVAGRAERVYNEHSVQSRITLQLTREQKPLITGTPVPRWDLLRLGSYNSMPVQFSRGCPFDCDFCDIIVLNGHLSRAKTPPQMLAELEALYLAGWRGSVFIVDDNFIGNKTEVRRLLPALIEWQREKGYPFSLFTEASVDLGNHNHYDILTMMVEAGFTDVFMGIESPDEDALRLMNKGQNRGDLAGKVRTVQEAGLEVLGGFIIGSDGDKPTLFENTIRFIQDTGVVIAMAGLLTALRHTKLWKRLQKEGRLVGESTGNNTHHFGFNFVPKLEEQFLIEGYIQLLQKLYSSRAYYDRCRALRARRGVYRRAKRLDRSGITAAMRIFWHNLVRRPDKEFFRYLWETLRQSPDELPEAITQAVKLYHFRLITEATVNAYRYPERVASLMERFGTQMIALRGTATKRLRQVEKLERQLRAEAIRLCHSIPRDFRAGAEAARRAWEEKFSQIVAEYRQKFQQTSSLG